ncbi:MAG: NAD(P)(+) transhydrogenase (Re/Si-specific) subunit beta [Candidatus Omnitrophica bacterium]|nr:NAD(P)(+) transhydrogenase (Re/Si-specific) subunit beta [Candidatus Omnitrophota bacterium]
MDLSIAINFTYIVSAMLFIFGLKMLSSPATARKGNMLSAIGMFLAVVATLLTKGLSFQWIIIGVVVGSIVGALAARLISMTAMPEMVALFNGSGGIASLIVGWAVYHYTPAGDTLTTFTIFLAVLIGGVTFTGSVIAWAKLAEKITGKPILYTGQQIVNVLILLMVIACGVIFCMNPAASYPIFIATVVISLILGVLVVIPIGGADMPVVISLLNSYSGLAACAAGFVIQNNILIVAGSLVGASGLILTNIMCKAMNRSLANVLFSGFGATVQKKGSGEQQGEVKPASVEDVYYILEAASSVAFVPGYGLAVAQAQHVVRELGELLEANGTEVKYAVHPVAGRMPGHMNVLLAEANVPYDQLVEMDDINPTMDTVDVCIVIGANDVVNPAARHDESSPIYGMPIINVDYAKTVIVLKRSMAAGFAGIQNELFFYDNTRMLFGDAKASITSLLAEFKSA